MIGFEDRTYRRRKHQRLPIVVLCDISAHDTGEILGKGCVLNYSRGGLAVISPAEMAWDSLVNLTVDRLDHEGFITAKIVNSRPVMDGLFSYGIEFDGLNPLKKIQMERRFKKLFRLLLSSAPRTSREF
jgi:hypothetical protein